MKVTGFRTWVVRVPYEDRMHGTHIVLQLDTDAGVQGIGFISCLMSWVLKAQAAAVEACAAQVIGSDPQAVEAVNDMLLARGNRPQFDGLKRSAVAAIDIALWDIRGKTQDLPLYRMLGGTSNRVAAYASWNMWWRYDLDTLVRHAQEHLAHGFRQMKYRMGGIGQDADAIERTRVLRAAVGSGVDLMVDFNWSWSVERTIAVGRAIEEQALFWLEDPIPADDVAGLKKIAAALSTPVCTGETYDHAAQFRTLLDHRGADYVMIDLEVGGITQWLRLAQLMASYGVSVASHLCSEVSAHLVAAVPNGLTVEYIPWAAPLFTEGARIDNGMLLLSDRPGLGLELDPAAMRAHAI